VYSNLVKKLKNAFDGRLYLVHVCEGDDFLLDVGKETNTSVIPLNTPLLAAAKILGNASVYISGRYHPAIMSSLGGTPCVFMSSNSHKTKSLQELLEYDDIVEFNVVPDDEECKKIIEKALSLNEQGYELRNKIKKRAKELSDKAKEMKHEIRV
jgi:polysaccharide pyruvyl transferase WcaK-like protein